MSWRGSSGLCNFVFCFFTTCGRLLVASLVELEHPFLEKVLLNLEKLTFVVGEAVVYPCEPRFVPPHSTHGFLTVRSFIHGFTSGERHDVRTYTSDALSKDLNTLEPK